MQAARKAERRGSLNGPKFQRTNSTLAPSHHRSDTHQETLTEIFNLTKSRTIAVNGTNEIEVEPDLVRLSFKVSEQDADYMEAVRATLGSLDLVREAARNIGITNDKMSCDSMSVKQFHQEPKIGKKPKKATLVYQPSIILRIRLEGEKVSLFGKLMVTFLKLGIENYQAPIYETTKLDQFRNKARVNAIKNAKEKADLILSGLDLTLSSGCPISINDMHVNTTSDSDKSFEGSPWYLNIPLKKPRSPDEESKDSHSSGEDSSNSPVTFDPDFLERTDDLFSVPPISLSAYIKVIFEISESKD